MRRIARAINRRDKRGTVLIFAIGALAVISVIAVSYVSVVRIERNSAAAVLSQNNRDQSVNIVVDKIREVIAADLFGNKVVTPATPKVISGNGQTVRVWPAMFEDGEFYDYPMVDRLDPGLDENFNTGTPDDITFDKRFFNKPSTIPREAREDDNWVLDVIPNFDRYETANPDDAWLATTEPEYHNRPQNATTEVAWRNITNLRSTYRFVFEERGRRVENSNGQAGLWVRADGRFADLGEFFNNDDTNANDTSVLTDFGDGGRDISVIDPEFGSVHHNGSGALDLGAISGNSEQSITSVYQQQMDVLDDIVIDTEPTGLRSGGIIPRNQSTGDEVLDAKDERFWTDTDGDLRADARWQVLDELGNLANLRWVVATRIIDASSLINVNTSLSFDAAMATTNDGLDQISAGRTPADIDLFRFLERSRDGNPYYGFPDVTTGQLTTAWNQHHLPLGLGLTGGTGSIYEELRNQDSFTNERPVESLPYIDTFNDIGPSGTPPTNRNLRSAYYEFVGSAPLRTGVRSAITYPAREIKDLMAFWGTNDASSVTKLEQRLDWGNPPLFPTAIEDYGATTDLGPMRSREDPREARNFETDRPTVEELRASVRNAITTVSGVGDYSPVPVLNDAGEFSDTYRNRKINLRRLAERANQRDTNGRSELRGEDVKPIFEAFTWALAPFATDEPYSSDLFANNSTLFTNPQGEDFHYGGGSGMNELADVLFVDPATGMDLSGDAGPSVALMTAASLTANLIDAIDDESMVGANDDTPTILRILPRENRLPPQGRPGIIADQPDTLPIELGLNFSHGEVRPFQMSFTDTETFFGDDLDNSRITAFNDANNRSSAETAILDRGLTVVGLEAQPFITDAFALSTYTEAPAFDGIGNDDAMIDTSEQLGSFFAVKLYNPWPIELVFPVDGYHVVIPSDLSGTQQIDPDPSGSDDLRFVLPGETIPAGEARIFYWSLGSDGAPWKDSHDPTNAPGQAIEPAIVEALEMDSGTTLVPFESGPVGDETNIVDWDGNPGDSGAVNRRPAVMFQTLGQAGESLPVLLMRRLNEATGASVGGSTTDTDFVLVDRLQNDGNDMFPGVLTDPVTLSPIVGDTPFDNSDLIETGFLPLDTNEDRDNNGSVGGRITIMSNISRPKENNSNGGWPTSVIEKPSDNRSSLHDPLMMGLSSQRVFYAQLWLSGPSPDLGLDPPADEHPRTSPVRYLLQNRDNANTPSFMFNDDFDASGDGPVDQTFIYEDAIVTTSSDIPPFQLYVPNAPLNTTGEIGKICTYAHTCTDHRLLTLDNWSTVSEKLGLALDVRGDMTNDPYLGVLDPTQYMFGSVSGQGVLDDPFASLPADAFPPENLTVPLATRVYDCFEALDPIEPLKQGVINVNTASARVLEMLPFMEPRVDYMGGGRTLLANNVRANALVEYRDRLNSDDPISGPLPIDLTNPANTMLGTGLRNTGRPGAGGISALGELSIIDEWDPASGNPMSGSELFAQLGNNMQQEAAATAGNPTFLDLTPHSQGTLDPIDDPEERNRIFEALSNVTSTRSDLFLAWFVVRGYDPADIERIPIAGAPEDSLVNPDLPFEPVFNRRYLLVLDRSNIEKPTDRPRVLLQLRLPDLSE